MKEDGKCLECQIAALTKELEKWKAEALKHAEKAVYWEDRARKAEASLKETNDGT